MTAPGWYQAPSDPPGTRRWWDGQAWTAQVVAQPELAPTTPAPAAAPLPLRVLARTADWAIAAIFASAVHRVWAPRLLDDVEFSTWFSIDEVFSTSTPPTMLFATMVVVTLWEVFWLLAEGASPGKQLFGLYVRDPQSPRGTVEVKAAMRRNVHRLLLIVPFGWAVVAAMSAVSLGLMYDDREERRSLMDRFADTTVHRVGRGSPRFTPWLSVWIVAVFTLRGLAWVLH